MQSITTQIDVPEGELNWDELFRALWKGKYFIILMVVIFAISAVYYAFEQPDIYKSEALLAPAADSSGMKVGGQLGGLAALAGVNLGGESSGDKTSLALEILKSREFIGNFIKKNDLLIPVMAHKKFDTNNNSLVLDPKIYDVETKMWVRKVGYPYKQEPSLLEAIIEFSKLFNVNRDKNTGMIKISLEYVSPILAKEWIDLLIAEINEDMRRRDLNEANESISYLNKKLEHTNVSDMRAMLFSLIEEQTKTIMLANVRDEYVLKTVDPSYVPELKVGPKRLSILVVGVFLGLMLSIIILLIREFTFNRK